MSGLPPAGSVLKPIAKYLQQARLIEKVDPVIAYYCRLHALQVGMKLPGRTPADLKLIGDIMTQLETSTAAKGLSKDDARAKCEAFALQVFEHGDTEDRAGLATKKTALNFHAAYVLLDMCRQFGPLASDVEEKLRYAVVKAADINKAIKEGRTPKAGPLNEPSEEEMLAGLSAEMAAGGGAGAAGSSGGGMAADGSAGSGSALGGMHFKTAASPFAGAPGANWPSASSVSSSSSPAAFNPHASSATAASSSFSSASASASAPPPDLYAASRASTPSPTNSLPPTNYTSPLDAANAFFGDAAPVGAPAPSLTPASAKSLFPTPTASAPSNASSVSALPAAKASNGVRFPTAPAASSPFSKEAAAARNAAGGQGHAAFSRVDAKRGDAVREGERLIKHALSSVVFSDVDTACQKMREALAILQPFTTQPQR